MECAAEPERDLIYLRMDEIGYNHRHDKAFCIDRPDGTGDWLLLIVKTPAHFRIDGKDVKTPANSFIIFTPGTPQHYYPATDEYFDDWIHFGPDESEQALISELNIPLNVPVTLRDISDISNIAGNMCFEQYSENPFRQQEIDLYFRLLLYKIAEKMSFLRSETASSEKLYFEKLRWIRESIYRWPSRNYSIDDMAKELSLSRSRFQHLYTETFGVSVNKDVITSRMMRAAELLKTTGDSIKYIGAMVGYENTSYFVKLFGSYYGMTPMQYRQTQNDV